MRKELAKIRSVRFGSGGYQDAAFGISFEFEGNGSSCGDFIGTWSSEPDDSNKWTKSDQTEFWGNMVREIRDTMKAAKTNNLNDLVGKPVELTFNGNQLDSWRILTEVI